MDQRLKGQESQVFMTQDGETLAQLDSIQDSEITAKFTLLQEGYLGETTDRYDEVFHGISGGFSAHITTGAVFDIVQAVMDRARRRTPGVQFNYKTTLQFPNGERKRIIIPNIFFGDMPLNLPKRDQYATLKFTFSASSGRFL